MEKDKQKRVEAAGWKIGDVEELLNLTQEESSHIELKLSLSQNLQKWRRMLNITQQDFARLIKSSQSRVAKMEAGDPSVCLDLLVRPLLALKTPKRALSCMLPK